MLVVVSRKAGVPQLGLGSEAEGIHHRLVSATQRTEQAIGSSSKQSRHGDFGYGWSKAIDPNYSYGSWVWFLKSEQSSAVDMTFTSR